MLLFYVKEKVLRLNESNIVLVKSKDELDTFPCISLSGNPKDNVLPKLINFSK